MTADDDEAAERGVRVDSGEREARGGRRDPVVVIGAAALAVALLFVIWHTVDALLIVFGGVVLAQLLRAFTELLAERTGLRESWSFAAVVALLVGTAVSATAIAAPHVRAQLIEGRERLPTSVEDAKGMLEQSGLGRGAVQVLEAVGGEDGGALLTDLPIGAPFTLVAYALGVLFVGLFVGATPRMYRDGVVRLFPTERRERARDVLRQLGQTLRWWMVGQSIAMTFVGVLVSLALWVIGIPLPLLLGLLVGLLTFMPYVGPFIGAFPVLAVTLLLDPGKFFYVFLAYTTIQSIEGYVLTPLVQRQAVRLPPAVTVSAQFVMALLVGPVGVVFATPLAAVLLVLTREVYVGDVLGDGAAKTAS